MPVNQETNLNIVCDNPDCPGNDLDSSDRTSWIFVSHEVYGNPTQQSVFCSSECISAAALLATDDPNNGLPPNEISTQMIPPPPSIPPVAK
jgi:hypothetical protein